MKLSTIRALIKLKFVLTLKNISAIIGSVLALGFAILFKLTLHAAPFAAPGMNKSFFILQMCYIFNAVMSGIMMTSIPMAQEKEKKTIRVLMTSSVNEFEYLIAAIIPPFIIIFLTDLLIVPLSGVSFTVSKWVAYIVISIFTILLSMVIGFIMGVLSRKVSDTSYWVMPVLLPLVLIPQLSNTNAVFSKLSEYLYTGVMVHALNNIYFQRIPYMSMLDISVITVEFIIVILIFAISFRKRGLS